MTTLKHVATLLAKRTAFSGNITDLKLIDTDRGTVLVSVANKGAGLTSFNVGDADQAAVGKNHRPANSYGTYYSAPRMEVVDDGGGGSRIVITGQQGSVHSGMLMAADGNLKGFVPLFAAGQMPGDVVAIKIFEIAGQSYVLTGTDGSMGMTLYRMGADLSLSRLGAAAPGGRMAVDAEYTDIEVMRIGSKTFAYAASAQGNMLTIYEVGEGGISSTGVIDKSNTIGISAPREVEAVTTEHGRFLIVTGGESDSLTVFRILPTGGLSLTDHVIDSATTRFDAATAIATVEMAGRVYIFVGGADDGISVLTLDGQGRLILLHVLADTDAMTLANVSAMAAKQVGGKIALFVTSATETGITQLSFDPGNIGKSLVGIGRLSGTAQDDILIGTGASSALAGGAGDDILIARSGVVNMLGGAGRDTFVPGYGATLVTILDFEPGRDLLDLSELAFIRSIAQLKILSTATGALLEAGPVRIEIRTASGASLRASDFTNDMFRLAHYANGIDYSGLVTPIGPSRPGQPDPDDPHTNSPPTGTSGGYVDPAPLPDMIVFPKPVLGTDRGDRLLAPATGAEIWGQGGDDHIIGAAGARSNLLGGAGKDTLIGGALSDYLDGGDGDDTLLGGGGHDRLYGGNGNDFIAGGAGDDRIHGGPGRNTLIGNDGNDVIIATGNGGNLMRGDAGHDYIQGVGADTIYGGDGHDRLFSGGNNNRIWGGDGNDLIRVTGSSNVLVGGAGNDTVYGGVGRDYIYGGHGDDLLYGGGGNDFIIAHEGNDTLYGDAGDDHLIGMEGNDVIYGGPGNDLLWGVEGDDLIFGGAGDDSIRGGIGRDTLHGGDGNDRMLGGDGSDQMYGGAGHDNMYGQNGNDSMYGGDGNDFMNGGPGRDLLDGGNGHDELWGGAGDDVLRGGAGNDTLIGGADNDTLTGGAGNDIMTGGTGADVFVFTAPSGGAVEYDTITDFQPGVDMIDLSAVVSSFTWMGAGKFSGTGRAEIRVQESSSRTRVMIDADGDGAADLVIDLLGGPFSPFDLFH